MLTHMYMCTHTHTHRPSWRTGEDVDIICAKLKASMLFVLYLAVQGLYVWGQRGEFCVEECVNVCVCLCVLQERVKQC